LGAGFCRGVENGLKTRRISLVGFAQEDGRPSFFTEEHQCHSENQQPEIFDLDNYFLRQM
jgi:hypothetical protein